jgi:hypothetical protein
LVAKVKGEGEEEDDMDGINIKGAVGQPTLITDPPSAAEDIGVLGIDCTGW